MRQKGGRGKLRDTHYRAKGRANTSTLAGGVGDAGAGGGRVGMMMAAGSSLTHRNEASTPRHPPISHRRAKDGDDQHAHRKPQAKPRGVIGGGGRDAIGQPTPPFPVYTIPSSSDDDDDSVVVVVDPPRRPIALPLSSSSRTGSGGGATATTQVKRRRESGRHSGGKEAVESPVASPTRKVERGQGGPRGSHDKRQKERGGEDRVTGAAGGGRGMMVAASSVPHSRGPSSSHASATHSFRPSPASPHRPTPRHSHGLVVPLRFGVSTAWMSGLRNLAMMQPTSPPASPPPLPSVFHFHE